MGAKELSSHQDPPFLPWERKEESRGAIVGVTDQRDHTNIHVRPTAQSKEEPLLGHRKNPLRPSMAEDKRNGLPLRVTLQIIPWNRISTKTKKNNGRNGNI